jgi:hypothetical protein
VSFEPRVEADELTIVLRGVDRVLCWRRAVRVELAAVTSARRLDRQELEPRLEGRVYGRGTHRGDGGRGRARVGAFLGRDVPGQPQFWAVTADARTVVAIDLDDRGPFRRVVLGGSSCPSALLDLCR